MIKFYSIRHPGTGLHLNHDGSGGTQNIDHMLTFTTRAKAREYKRNMWTANKYRIAQWIMRTV